jgi:hypothetical protein
MTLLAGRPRLVLLLVGIIWLSALSFLADAVDFFDWQAPQSPVTGGLRSLGVPESIAAVIAAALLARRGYLLLLGRRGAWLSTLALFVLKVASAMILLLVAGKVIGGPFSIALPVAAVATLLSPRVRRWFSARAVNR